MTTPQDASRQPRSIGATSSENSTAMISEPPAVTAPVEPQTARLKCVALEKAFRKGDHVIPVLRGVDIDVAPGEFLSIVGQSGSGKSTLLHVMGLLDVPSVGEVHCDGRRIDNLPESQRDRLRNREFGFIFQSYHLLPELTLLENVVSPLSIRYSTLGWWQHRRQIRDRATEIVEKVGLGHRLKHRPAELSGGEMQRTAIARALIGQPRVLLADEPTGNLDSNTGQEIMSLLASLNEFEGLTIIMVTHDERIACRAHRTVRLGEGRIEMVGRAA